MCPRCRNIHAPATPTCPVCILRAPLVPHHIILSIEADLEQAKKNMVLGTRTHRGSFFVANVERLLKAVKNER